ncbi:hypothetical protein [Bordetella genomosp. 2]|uniref:Transmembrane protein n=1 Tax=Bordetella genomosp. 2 TaxID=1983456 RepID=A0A261W0N7_9BORD|nr:hypothetical protein [Bordetella genomosp. 2]OZI79885.1 hypothetical protein CAL24_08205 [Bordetella genomosp. 2]
MEMLIASALTFWALWLPLAWFAAAAFAAHLASEKNRCGACWFLWGVLFGPLALIATAGLPSIVERRGLGEAGSAGEGGTVAKLPTMTEKPGAKAAVIVIIAVLVAVYLLRRYST